MPAWPERPAWSTRAVAGTDDRVLLRKGWLVAAAEPDAAASPQDIDSLNWLPARVPGTVAGALANAGGGHAGETPDLDAHDWWFRVKFDSEPAQLGEQVLLCLDGIATVFDAHLNGELICQGRSMFVPVNVDVGRLLRGENELVIRCRALAPLLEQSRRPRARWRTRVATPANLRFVRTMLLGRAPGFAPGPATVGPWREVSVLRRRDLAVEALAVRPRLVGDTGVLRVTGSIRALSGREPDAARVLITGPSGDFSAPLALHPIEAAGTRFAGEVSVPDAARWWPHTHGEPALHDIQLLVELAGESVTVRAGRTGFRELTFGSSNPAQPEHDGLDIRVNGVPVFARGALWTPLDPVGMAPAEGSVRRTLETVREGGMNILRIPGTGCYETREFLDLCDELGILLWQDFMFANFDYPIADPDFRADVLAEARTALEAIGGRPSLAVLCGNSEVEQQAAMLGLDADLGRGELFGELLPEMVAESQIDATYLPSAPCGGMLPFRPACGVANYFGVGGYLRPLEDARRAQVRFASECLAFSNVPDEEAIAAMATDAPALQDPAGSWKAGVPRDVGADWDFEDVRDHYLQMLFSVDPGALREADSQRYLELSRAVTGEVMAETFGEWRRAGSPCAGALVLWLKDLLPGAGWGVLDDRGDPKPAFHHLRRALAPVALWTVDEGLGGVVAHVANDGPSTLAADLHLALYRGGEQSVGEAQTAIDLSAHSQGEWDVEGILGRFADVGWAYRFGPPAQDAIVLRLLTRGHPASLIAHAVRFPVGRPLALEAPGDLGLEGSLFPGPDGNAQLHLRTRRLAYGVRIHAGGLEPQDNWLTLEPGAQRTVSLRPGGRGEAGSVELGALNMQGRVTAQFRASAK
jgi:beta-mannosidase